MPDTPENQFPYATTEQVRGWIAHDSGLIQNGAEIVNGQLIPSQEQHEKMRQEMVSELAGSSAVENVVSIEQSHLIQEASENTANVRGEQVKSAAIEALNKVMIPSLGAQPEAISRVFKSKTILPKGSDGEIASQVASIFSGRSSRDRITPDQMKWFALGVATQANAANNFKGSSSSEELSH